MVKKVFISFFHACLLSIFLNAQSTQLVVRGFSEGFYRPSTGKMAAVIDSVNMPLICDSGIIGLIDTSTLQSVFCAYSLITTDGYGNCTVPSYLNGHYFLVSIKFKNTFHLISKHTIKLNGLPKTVDLTIPQNACCNFDSANGVAKAFSGDINSDGTIDGTDFLLMDQDIQNNAMGYLITDLNGDRVVDTSDFNIFNNNLIAGRNDDYNGICRPSLIGISETEMLNVNVYPNPCKDYFTIILDQVYRNIQCTLYDVLGKVCLNNTFEDASTLRINSNQMYSGVYVIKISADDRRIKQGVLIVNNN